MILQHIIVELCQMMGVFDNEPLDISKFVHDKADQLKHNGNLYHTPVTSCQVTSEFILHAIKSLKKGASPGCDGLTAEHLFFAASLPLAFLYSKRQL